VVAGGACERRGWPAAGWRRGCEPAYQARGG
jgi:hypothetical protein